MLVRILRLDEFEIGQQFVSLEEEWICISHQQRWTKNAKNRGFIAAVFSIVGLLLDPTTCANIFLTVNKQFWSIGKNVHRSKIHLDFAGEGIFWSRRRWRSGGRRVGQVATSWTENVENEADWLFLPSMLPLEDTSWDPCPCQDSRRGRQPREFRSKVQSSACRSSCPAGTRSSSWSCRWSSPPTARSRWTRRRPCGTCTPGSFGPCRSISHALKILIKLNFSRSPGNTPESEYKFTYMSTPAHKSPADHW